jgi:hypothetical protein
LLPADRVLAHPAIWGLAVQDIASLNHGQWIDHSVINFFLLLRWYDLRHTSQTYFVDMVFTYENIGMEVDGHRISLFRSRYPSLRLPSQRVIFVAFHNNHYFVALFDYNVQIAWLLGANITRRGCFEGPEVLWEEWNGHRMWPYISTLFGWHVAAEQPSRVIGIDWKQVRHLEYRYKHHVLRIHPSP